MDTTTATRLATWAEASPFLAPLVREVEGRRITDAIDADPAEVVALRESRRQARRGERHPWASPKQAGARRRDEEQAP